MSATCGDQTGLTYCGTVRTCEFLDSNGDPVPLTGDGLVTSWSQTGNTVTISGIAPLESQVGSYGPYSLRVILDSQTLDSYKEYINTNFVVQVNYHACASTIFAPIEVDVNG